MNLLFTLAHLTFPTPTPHGTNTTELAWAGLRTLHHFAHAMRGASSLACGVQLPAMGCAGCPLPACTGLLTWTTAPACRALLPCPATTPSTLPTSLGCAHCPRGAAFGTTHAPQTDTTLPHLPFHARAHPPHTTAHLCHFHTTPRHSLCHSHICIWPHWRTHRTCLLDSMAWPYAARLLRRFCRCPGRYSADFSSATYKRLRRRTYLGGIQRHFTGQRRTRCAAARLHPSSSPPCCTAAPARAHPSPHFYLPPLPHMPLGSPLGPLSVVDLPVTRAPYRRFITEKTRCRHACTGQKAACSIPKTASSHLLLMCWAAGWLWDLSRAHTLILVLGPCHFRHFRLLPHGHAHTAHTPPPPPASPVGLGGQGHYYSTPVCTITGAHYFHTYMTACMAGVGHSGWPGTPVQGSWLPWSLWVLPHFLHDLTCHCLPHASCLSFGLPTTPHFGLNLPLFIHFRKRLPDLFPPTALHTGRVPHTGPPPPTYHHHPTSSPCPSTTSHLFTLAFLYLLFSCLNACPPAPPLLLLPSPCAHLPT